MLYRYFRIRAILRKFAQIPQIMSRDTKIYPDFSASHFTLNEVLLKCQGNLRVELYLLQGVWGHSGDNATMLHNFSNLSMRKPWDLCVRKSML